MLRSGCAPVAAPKPALRGVRRVGSSVPSGRYCELRTVRSVGLRYWIWVTRLLITTTLNALKASRRNWSWRAPPRRMLRASARSTVLSGQRRQDVAARFQTHAAVGRPGHRGHVELPVLVARAALPGIADVDDLGRVVRRTRQVHVRAVVLVRVAQVVPWRRWSHSRTADWLPPSGPSLPSGRPTAASR